MLIGHHTMTVVGHCNAARTVASGNKTCGWHSPQPLHHHLIMGSRVIGVQCQHPHWCHQGLIEWEVPGNHTMADAAGN